MGGQVIFLAIASTEFVLPHKFIYGETPIPDKEKGL
jgi:hypothetical protein